MFEQLPKLSSLCFFYEEINCYFLSSSIRKKKYLLPSFSAYLLEENYAKVFLAWDKENIYAIVKMKIEKDKNKENDTIRKKDSVEFFFDTRDNKKKSFFTRFCHHFLFSQKNGQKIKGEEVTRFRGDDMHDLCKEEDLFVSTEFSKNSYYIEIKIPSHSLFGFDPKNFNRLGFTYRIKCDRKEPQYFNMSTQEFSVEQNPSLWSSLNLIV